MYLSSGHLQDDRSPKDQIGTDLWAFALFESISSPLLAVIDAVADRNISWINAFA